MAGVRFKPSCIMDVSEDFTPKIKPQILATLAGMYSNDDVLYFICQYYSIYLVATSSFSLGSIIVWTSPSIPDLEKSETFGILTLEDKSWIASLVTVNTVVPLFIWLVLHYFFSIDWGIIMWSFFWLLN